MVVLDALICNIDRHYGNFGFLIDNRTNKIVSPAPLFDHGNSLFYFAGQRAWESEAALEEYIATLEPSVYNDFIGTAKAMLTPEHRERLRHMLLFRVKKHSRYNLPDKRLKMIELILKSKFKNEPDYFWTHKNGGWRCSPTTVFG